MTPEPFAFPKALNLYRIAGCLCRLNEQRFRGRYVGLANPWLRCDEGKYQSAQRGHTSMILTRPSEPSSSETENPVSHM